MLGLVSVSVRMAVRSFFTPVGRKSLGFSASLDIDLTEAMSPGTEQAFPFLRMKKVLKKVAVLSHLT